MKQILTLGLTLLLSATLAAAQVCATNCGLLPDTAAAPVRSATTTAAPPHCHQHRQTLPRNDQAQRMERPPADAPHQPGRSSNCVVHILTAAMKSGRTTMAVDQSALLLTAPPFSPPGAFTPTAPARTVVRCKPPPGHASRSVLRI